MPRYAITEKAGRVVAGRNNTGQGTILTLTEEQAAHDVEAGRLVLVPDEGVAQEEATHESEPAPEAPVVGKGKRGKGKAA